MFTNDFGGSPIYGQISPQTKRPMGVLLVGPPKSASREINAGPKLVQQLAPPTSTAVHVERLLFTEKSVEIEVGWEILAIFDQNPIIIPTKTLGCPSMITHNMFFFFRWDYHVEFHIYFIRFIPTKMGVSIDDHPLLTIMKTMFNTIY